MEQSLLEKLREITPEEQKILKEKAGVEKSLYTSGSEFVVDRKKMLAQGKLIAIRTHTRFVHFPRHRHNYIEIIYMCSGSTTHIIGEKSKVLLKQGELLFLNENAVHEILPAGMDDVGVNFIVLPEFFDIAFEMMEEEDVLRDFFVGTLKQEKRGADYIHFCVSDVLPIQNLMESMIWSLVHKQANKRNVYKITMGILFVLLSGYLDRACENDPKRQGRNRMFSILQYIEENYKSGSLAELAEIYGQSVTGMSRFIKKETGMTFKDLVMQKRLNQAAFLLGNTKLTVEEIIAAVGYDNSSYFHRIFREKYGLTPRKYRLEAAGK